MKHTVRLILTPGKRIVTRNDTCRIGVRRSSTAEEHAPRTRRNACCVADCAYAGSRPTFAAVIVMVRPAAVVIIVTPYNDWREFFESIFHAVSPPFSSRFWLSGWLPDRAASAWNRRLLVIAANCIGEQPGLVAVVPVFAVLVAVEPPVQDSGRGRLAFVAPVESFAIRLFVHLSHPLSGGFCFHRTAPARFVVAPTRTSLCRATVTTWQNPCLAGSVESSEILRRSLRHGLNSRRRRANCYG